MLAYSFITKIWPNSFYYQLLNLPNSIHSHEGKPSPCQNMDNKGMLSWDTLTMKQESSLHNNTGEGGEMARGCGS